MDLGRKVSWSTTSCKSSELFLQLNVCPRSIKTNIYFKIKWTTQLSTTWMNLHWNYDLNENITLADFVFSVVTVVLFKLVCAFSTLKDIFNVHFKLQFATPLPPQKKMQSQCFLFKFPIKLTTFKFLSALWRPHQQALIFS